MAMRMPGQTNQTAMRKLVIIALTLMYFVPGKLSAQSVSDTSEILQKVIDLPQLQQFYPLGQNNSPKQLIVLQHGISFSSSIAVSHNNQPLALRSKANIGAEPAYFLFWAFNVSEASAHIEFSYNYYNQDTQSKAAQKVILTFAKSAGNWTITNTNIETVQL